MKHYNIVYSHIHIYTVNKSIKTCNFRWVINLKEGSKKGWVSASIFYFLQKERILGFPAWVLHASGTLLPSCSVSPIRNSLSAKALGVTTPPPHTSLPWRQGTWLMLSLGGDSNMHGWVRGTLHLHLALTSAQSQDTSEERNASWEALHSIPSCEEIQSVVTFS